MRFSVVAVAACAGLAAAKPLATRQTGINIADEALSVVQGAGETIFTQLGDITTLLLNTITQGVIPQVQSSLNAVGGELQDVKTFVDGQLQETIVPLVEGELAVVPELLQSTIDIVSETRDTLKSLVDGLLSALLTSVKDEVQFVLDTIEPAVTPVIELARSLTGTAQGDVVDQINSLISDLESLSTSALEPIQAALDRLV